MLLISLSEVKKLLNLYLGTSEMLIQWFNCSPSAWTTFLLSDRLFQNYMFFRVVSRQVVSCSIEWPNDFARGPLVRSIPNVIQLDALSKCLHTDPAIVLLEAKLI